MLTLWVAHPNVTSMEICQSINFNKLRAQHIIKKLCFCVFLKVSFDNLFDITSSLENILIKVLEKRLEKVLTMILVPKIGILRTPESKKVNINGLT